MIRVAIVEDEEKYRELFRIYVNRFSEENGLDMEVQLFSDGFEISEDYTPKWDVILLDIQMKHQDGMTAARIIRDHDEDVPIMFITTLAQYALHGYEVGATDYVLKPVEYEKFAFRFKRVIRQLKNSSQDYIMLPAEDGQDKVQLSEIQYIDVVHHDIYIHLKDREYRIRQSISNMEQEFLDKGFFRCDRAVIVNLSAITKIGKDTVYVGDQVLPISRSRKKAFLEAVARYNK